MINLEINLGIKENFKTGYTTLFFNLSNREKLDSKIISKASQYFKTGWSGIEQTQIMEKDSDKLYGKAGQTLAGFIRGVSSINENPTIVHYHLFSDYDEKIHGAYVPEEVVKATYTRKLTPDELRDVASEVKKALEGL